MLPSPLRIIITTTGHSPIRRSGACSGLSTPFPPRKPAFVDRDLLHTVPHRQQKLTSRFVMAMNIAPAAWQPANYRAPEPHPILATADGPVYASRPQSLT